MTTKTMTIEEVAHTFSSTFPVWQKDINIQWLKMIHAMLKEGGIWESPMLGVIYQKEGDGFLFIEDIQR